MTPHLPVETFPALEAIAGIRHGFIGRVPGLDVKMDRELALRRLDESGHATGEAVGDSGESFERRKCFDGKGRSHANLTAAFSPPEPSGAAADS